MKKFSRCLLLLLLLSLLATTGVHAIHDSNMNGVSDLWEETYNNGSLATTFDPTADPDGDGWTNIQEATAGTHPFQANGLRGYIRPKISYTPAVYSPPEEEGGAPELLTPEAASVRWPTLPGKKYSLFFSTDLTAGSWTLLRQAISGTGTDITQVVPLPPSGGTSPAGKFWRVTVTDSDLDADTLTDSEELEIGSSIYFADTNGDGIDDPTAYASGKNPADLGPDANGDGIPDNALYSVEFEVTEESKQTHVQGFTGFVGTVDLHRYLTLNNSEEFSIIDSPHYTDIQNGKRTEVVSYYLNGLYYGSPVTHYEGISYADSLLAHERPAIALEERLEWGSVQTTITHPPDTATEVVTTTTTISSWRVMKRANSSANETILRSGTETRTKTHRKILKNQVTFQEFWTNYFRNIPWSIPDAPLISLRGPNEWALIKAATSLGEKRVAEIIRDNFKNDDFQIVGQISDPSSWESGTSSSPYRLTSEVRLKSLRWRWIRFSPIQPLDYKYEAPPASYLKQFNLVVRQRDQIGLLPGVTATSDETRIKGIIQIDCNSNAGAGWHTVAPEKYNIYKVEEPAGYVILDFSKSGRTNVTLAELPMAVALDANRNGEITFDDQDKTSAEKPFRFWVNNDRDDVEIDEPVLVEANDRDWLDNTIKTKRDLEDFCRLKVRSGLPIADLMSGEAQVGLKFVDASATGPSIKVWPNQSNTGDLKYLTDDSAAQQQIAKHPFETSQGVILIPASYWAADRNNTANLIFEGEAEGQAKLVVVIRDRNGVELGNSAGTWIQLMDVQKMYQRARIFNEAEAIPNPWENSNPPAQTWNWDPNGKSYVEDPAAEPITAVFVHGWRMQYTDTLNWASTGYKRLWHQGFKGKFYSFRWPTFSADNTVFRNNTFDNWQELHSPVPPGGFTYNASEYRAWLCGPALANFVNQLPNSGNRSLFAHSMGNVISGAALRNGMSVERYALCNAAMASMAYDSGSHLKIDPLTGQPWNKIWGNLGPQKTPDTDSSTIIRNTYGIQNKFNELGNPPAMINFYLRNDSALNAWIDNNHLFKPDDKGHSYYYQESPVAPNISYKLFHAPPGRNLREVTSPSEAFGYVTKALTRTVGSDPRTAGSIGSSVNMDDWGVGANHSGFGATHSAQWRWNNQSTNHFWERLCIELELLKR